MFASVAKYYEEEFDTAVSNLSSLIEPIMIALMGLLIGGLMLALILSNIQCWRNNGSIIIKNLMIIKRVDSFFNFLI